MTFNRLAVVLAATGAMSLVTVSTAAAPAACRRHRRQDHRRRRRRRQHHPNWDPRNPARAVGSHLSRPARWGLPGLGRGDKPGRGQAVRTGSLGASAVSQPKRWATISYGTAAGRRHWLQFYQGTDTSSDSTATPVAVTVSPDGSMVFVAGYVTNTGGVFAEATVAYDAATGARLWATQRTTDARPVFDAVSPDGSRVFVLSDDYTARAYDTATGNLVSSATATGLHGPSFARAGAMSQDGSRLFLTGSGFTPANREEFQTAAFDAATGATLWVQHYIRPHQPTGLPNLALAVVVSPDGSMVYVAGQAPGSTISNVVLGDDAATGAIRWARLSMNHAVTAAVSPDGSSVFLGGTRFGFHPTTNIFDTQAREPDTGGLRWTHPQTSRPPTDTNRTVLRAMAVSPDGIQARRHRQGRHQWRHPGDDDRPRPGHRRRALVRGLRARAPGESKEPTRRRS